ncbi:hypothetical protein FP744_10000451 [Trichoderma asperellum]
MGITITLISGNEDEAAVFSEAYCGHLSSVFRFDLDVSEPLSTSSRIVTCFHKIEVDDEKKTFPDRVSLRQAIRGSTSHVRPICASNPSICLPEFVIQIQHDDHDETTCKISHECAFHKYLASLLPIASVKDALIRKVPIAEPHYTSLESLHFYDKLCECPRALEAAEVYSVGRSLWAIFEQSDDVWVYKRGHSETKAVVWTHGSDSVPEAWKDFVSRCMNLDPNKRPTFEQGERFWGQEWKKHEGNTK